MKILMICGTYPPERCGIGDYLYKIVEQLGKERNYEVSILANINWQTSKILSIIKRVKTYNADIIHIQYPSQSYGLSFVPHLLSLRFRSLITIHEVSHSKLLRRLSLVFFSFRSEIIFTNIFEYNNFRKLFPWYRKKAIIIPIGSNVVTDLPISMVDEETIKSKCIVYFGQIRPKKGIEDLLELGKLLKENKSEYSVLIMGEVLPAFSDYWQELQNDARFKFVNFKLNLNFEDINTNLRNSTLAYLPFPDGVSERRGSMFAAFTNEIPVITTKGHQTTSEIEEIVTIVQKPHDIIRLIKDIGVNSLYDKMSLKKDKIKQFLANHSWESISKEHMDIYSKKINK